MKRIWMQHI